MNKINKIVVAVSFLMLLIGCGSTSTPSSSSTSTPTPTPPPEAPGTPDPETVPEDSTLFSYLEVGVVVEPTYGLIQGNWVADLYDLSGEVRIPDESFVFNVDRTINDTDNLHTLYTFEKDTISLYDDECQMIIDPEAEGGINRAETFGGLLNTTLTYEIVPDTGEGYFLKFVLTGNVVGSCCADGTETCRRPNTTETTEVETKEELVKIVSSDAHLLVFELIEQRRGHAVLVNN